MTPAITSCRSGRVVHLVNENGNQVPVRIKVRSTTGGQQQDGMSLYVVSVSGRAPAVGSGGEGCCCTCQPKLNQTELRRVEHR